MSVLILWLHDIEAQNLTAFPLIDQSWPATPKPHSNSPLHNWILNEEKFHKDFADMKRKFLD